MNATTSETFGTSIVPTLFANGDYPTHSLYSIPTESLSKYPRIKLMDGSMVWVDDSGVYLGPRRYPVFSPPQQHEINRAIEWLKSLNRFRDSRLAWVGSEELKWLLECEFSDYVSGGSLLVALQKSKIVVRPETRPHCPNFEASVPKKWMDWLQRHDTIDSKAEPTS